MNWDEYIRRCRENIEACNLIELSEDDKEVIGEMVFKQMIAEEMADATRAS